MTARPSLQKYLHEIPLSVEAQNYLILIEKNLPQDFSTSGRGYFSSEDEVHIAEKAFALAKEKLTSLPAPISEDSLKKIWNEIVTDFHRSGFWSFTPQAKKPKAALTEDQKTQREMWPYIWVLIQSGIILKTIVYFFGLRASEDPTPENKIYLTLALGTSAGTLIFFAWRKSRK